MIGRPRLVSGAVIASLALTSCSSHPPDLIGAIGQYYRSSTAVQAELGGPLKDEECDQAGKGCSQEFEHGRIYWSPATGAVHVREGAIADFYNHHGANNGMYGYPREPVSETKHGGGRATLRTVDPESGDEYRLERSDDGRVVPVKTSGDIGRMWSKDPERYGLPSDGETCPVPGSCIQAFDAADIVWSSSHGTHVLTSPALRELYDREHGVEGRLGVPVAAERPLAGSGKAQDFWSRSDNKSYTIVWGPETGAHVVETSGSIGRKWAELGGADGPLGLPRSDEFGALAGRGAYQEFEHGRIYWSPATGAGAIRAGSIQRAWDTQGRENGSWGYPISDEERTAFGTEQKFQRGIAREYGDDAATFRTYEQLRPAGLGKTLDEQATVLGLGKAVGETTTSAMGSYSKRYENGVLVHSDRYGIVALSPRVHEVWSSNPEPHGLPRSHSGEGPGRRTTFQHDALALDARHQLVRRVDKVLSERDALVIGDSQVAPPNSWVRQGISRAGLSVEASQTAHPGIGFTRKLQAGSYSAGILDNYWTLPQGAPRVIYLQGSGNDVYVRDAARVKQDASRTIRKLKGLYPESTIVLSGVLTRNIPEHKSRDEMSAVYEQVAAEEGIRFLPLKGWTSTYGATALLSPDHVHFTDAGHDHMAGPLAEHFRDLLQQG